MQRLAAIKTEVEMLENIISLLSSLCEPKKLLSSSIMKFLVVLATVAVVCNAGNLRRIRRGENGDQVPKVWDALKILSGNKDLTIEDIRNILSSAVAGKDYPANTVIPDKAVDCKSYAQPGYYADVSSPSNCQVFHRCDENGVATSYLCPAQTLFNQITLVCDWFYNIDCKSSKQFENYSNSRLNQEGLFLLDNQDEIIQATKAVSGKKRGQ